MAGMDVDMGIRRLGSPFRMKQTCELFTVDVL
jgi:hypothetical protein